MQASFIAILAIGCVACTAAGQTTTRPTSQPTSAPAPRLGAFRIAFTDQSPSTPLDAQAKRHRIRIEDMQKYTLADESFEVFVPEDYDPKQKYGILVWVSAGGRGTMPGGWTDLLTKHKLIGIGANNSGNQRGVAVRFGLAIDAVYNLRKLYTIDENRVYVSGVSGGGKVASMLAVIYPEVFRGAMPIVGVTYFREVPVPNEKDMVYARSFDRPPTAVLNRARQGRFVLITGSEDSNRDSTQSTYEHGFKKDGFRNVEYIEVPGLGHRVPEVDVIDRAIGLLDAPAAAPANRQPARRAR